MFEEFKGKEVKCCFKDGTQFRVARGTFMEMEDSLIKITGRLGTIIINKNDIRKMGLQKEVNENEDIRA